MGNEVYANNMEVSCKAADGKSICAFPDVCMTPPQTPATPPGVPIPYPNTGMASDCTDGSSSVQITGQEVMLKNKSYFKKSTGDEAGSAPLKGVVTHKNTGKVYFTMWSMDVHVEGENVVRNLDLTTHNHGCDPPNTMPWTYMDRMAMGMATGKCQKEADAAKDACGDTERKATCPPEGQALVAARAENSTATKQEVRALERKLGGAIQHDPCQKALRCFLTPYNSGHCCPGQTPDHLIEVKTIVEAGGDRETGKKIPGWDNYSASEAPCLCAEGHAAGISTHGVMSAKRKVAMETLGKDKGKAVDLDVAATIGAKSASTTFRGCSEECIKAQLMQYHESARTDPNAKVKSSWYGMGTSSKAKEGVLDRAKALMKA